MKFDYKRIASNVLRPVIPVDLGYKDFFVSYEVLVDSGADICLFDAAIGGLLNVPVLKGERRQVSGITGVPAYYYMHPVSIRVGGWEHKIVAGFLPNSPHSYGVVGQKGFFDLFVVTFDLLKERIELKERKNK